MKAKAVLMIFLLISAVTISADGNGTLTVVVRDIRPARGNELVLGIHNAQPSPDDDSTLVRIYTQAIEEDTESYTFLIEGLPAGEYMISGLHDADQDGEMDTGWFGIPSEGYFTSLNPSEPSWENSKFFYNGRDMSITVNMIYW